MPDINPNIAYVLPEVEAMYGKWTLIEDCIAGDEAIKAKKTEYLPQPNATDRSPENTARYDAYRNRAVFYNVVANTAKGLVGQVFNADPVSEYPEELEPLWYDADGRGVTLVQQAKKTLTAILTKGRCGLLVDFPKGKDDGTPFTRQEVLEGTARPTIVFYGARDIVNWRHKIVNAVSVLSLVVLCEDYIIKDDGFEIKRGKEYRVLRLTDADEYVVETWRRKNDDEDGPFELYDRTVPRNAKGAAFAYIPFYFVGAENNDPSVDKPPMYDMAVLNIAHYRNSADYEDSVWMVGQPTPYFAGLTESWVTEVLKGTIQLGSRAAVPLPEGASAGLLQAEPNSMVKEAMEQKERQMVALGAQLVEQKQVQRTLGEAKMENSVVNSTLTSCAHNTSQAIEAALISAAQFVQAEVDPNAITFQLSTDYAITKLTPDERRQLLTEWQGGLLSFTEARAQLRQSAIASLDDDEARAEIDKDMESAIDLAQQTGGNTDPNNPPQE
jgi:Domain of unknown function (DUF4055)